MTTTEINVVTDRARWLEERKQGVGASEAASALGISPFESPLGLYLRKTGAVGDVEETEAMRWGTMLEPLIAAEYERRTGRKVVAQQIHLKSPITPLMATLDGMTDADYPVEFKSVGAWAAKSLGEEESDQVPDHWLIQGHQQMLLSNTYEMEFAVLVAGQKLRVFHIDRDEDLVECLVAKVRAFWRHVLDREPPAADVLRDGRLMTLLYPDSDGEVTLGFADLDLVEQFGQLAEDRKDLDEERDAIRTRLLDRLGNHALGRLPDGRVVTRKVVKVAEGTFTRKAYEFTRIDIKKGPAT